MSMPGVPSYVTSFDLDASQIHPDSVPGAPDATGAMQDADGRRILVQFLRGPMGESLLKARGVADRVMQRLAATGDSIGAFMRELGRLDDSGRQTLARALSYSGDHGALSATSAGQRLDNRAAILMLAAEGIDVEALGTIRRRILDKVDLKISTRLGDTRHVIHLGEREKPVNRRDNLEAHANATLKRLLSAAEARELRPALARAVRDTAPEQNVYPATEILRQIFAQAEKVLGQSARASQLVNQVGSDVRLARDLAIRNGRKSLDRMLDQRLDKLPSEQFDSIYERVMDKLGPESALALKIQALAPNIVAVLDHVRPYFR